MEERSTIAVHSETQDRLNELKRVDSMTYDDVIRVLIQQADPEEAELIEANDAR